MDSDEWILIVPLMDRHLARAALAEWLERERSQGRIYGDDAIRVDLVLCSDRQCRERCFVRRSS
jgi:hypothetical protein